MRVVLVVCLLLVGLVIVFRVQRVKSPTPTDKTPNAKEQEADANPKPVLSDQQRAATEAARKNYVHAVREEFRNSGIDASISDLDGELTIVSDLLKRRPERDQLMRQQFGPAVRRNLCTMGFKSIALKSGVIFGDGDEYSLGCRESTDEKEARLQRERSARREYIEDMQRQFANDPQSQNMNVQEIANELVLTGPSFKSLSPQMIRSTFGRMFNDSAKRNLCGIGFRGLRTRADATSRGEFVSFNCLVNGTGGWAQQPNAKGSIRTSPEAKGAPATTSTVIFRLTTSPADANVIFDGISSTQCNSPCNVPLTEGRHSFVVQHAGYRDAHRIIEVPRDAVLIVDLTRQMGSLSVITNPPDLTLIIDGKVQVQKTPANLSLPVGTHHVGVMKGEEKREFEIEIRDGSLTSKFVDLILK